MVDERKYWLAFSLIPYIGPKRVEQLLRAFGSLAEAWHADERALRRAGLTDKAISSLLAGRAKHNLDAALAAVSAAGAHLLTLMDADYPAALKQIEAPPPVLYVRGQLLPTDERAICIVGTRRATSYGKDAAYALAHDLAAAGVTIVSGLAHGIDAVAHRAALDAGGRTIGVMGTGIDRMYPSDHYTLSRAVMAQGALISEFPLGEPSEARNFPRRNRVMSGLSRGVLVVEAPESSGALITSNFALEQGRDVFAVPGPVNSGHSIGTHKLIQDGAKLVARAADILEELALTTNVGQVRAAAREVVPASHEETQLLQHLGPQPLHIDELVRLSGLPVALVGSTLTVMELKGLARRVGAMHYTLA